MLPKAVPKRRNQFFKKDQEKVRTPWTERLHGGEKGVQTWLRSSLKAFSKLYKLPEEVFSSQETWQGLLGF